eukprot:CAMPEP_0172420520 /NCGR_PEP_ID=MMETSP1064-20121228/6882_1 /TAXON_ID=202472 /ORGANISM="Aulacoseira subarctica , Strain CCAP 1002/5" /LENGTH=843 /DNA_ID=CAMNT_0013160523 /DNA_START=261 /DNA_END=2792 /DNA_ORIENTATION=+
MPPHQSESSNMPIIPNRLFSNVSPQRPKKEEVRFCSSPQLMRTYFSRKRSSMGDRDLPVDKGPSGRGMYTPAGLFYFTIKLTVPLAYLYIATFVIRDIAYKTNTFDIISSVPILRRFLLNIEHLPLLVHIWAIIEAIFYVCLRLHIRWLQVKCPLEACLASAPMYELHERRELVERILDAVSHDPVSFIEGWFFDAPITSISRYDMLDFLSWCLFEGRSQEHLTENEVLQVHSFLAEIEYAISVHLYGVKEETAKIDFDDDANVCDTTADFENTIDTFVSDSSVNEGGHTHSRSLHLITGDGTRPPPTKEFNFNMDDINITTTFFTSLYESSKSMYGSMLENERVQDLRNFVQTKAQQLQSAEESALETAHYMYDNFSHMTDERMKLLRNFVNGKKQQIYESVVANSSTYYTLVEKHSGIDKFISTFFQATTSQLAEAWQMVRGIKNRPADFLINRTRELRKLLQNYRTLLDGMRSMSTNTVPTRHMADLMRKITKTNESLWEAESIARDAFIKASGYAMNLLPTGARKEPLPYAKYSFDSLFDISTYPLAFHLCVLSVTEGCLRIIMNRKGFEKRKIGPISYFFHPGKPTTRLSGQTKSDEEVPIVFIHGIGIGLIYYLTLIDQLLTLGRPVILPEIPYVTAFRAWLSPSCVLLPQVVSSTLTAMIYECGFSKAAFVGHSYGSSWVSYMCKLAPSNVACAVFLDPICFCLHLPFLTKQFVYQRSDPGSTSCIVRTDVNVNWTIQRGFPWTRVALFVEQIPVKAAVFLSEKDCLVPTADVQRYLSSKGASLRNFPDIDLDHFRSGDISVTTFQGVGHGDWVGIAPMDKAVIDAVRVLSSTSQK